MTHRRRSLRKRAHHGNRASRLQVKQPTGVGTSHPGKRTANHWTAIINPCIFSMPSGRVGIQKMQNSCTSIAAVRHALASSVFRELPDIHKEFLKNLKGILPGSSFVCNACSLLSPHKFWLLSILIFPVLIIFEEWPMKASARQQASAGGTDATQCTYSMQMATSSSSRLNSAPTTMRKPRPHVPSSPAVRGNATTALSMRTKSCHRLSLARSDASTRAAHCTKEVYVRWRVIGFHHAFVKLFDKQKRAARAHKKKKKKKKRSSLVTGSDSVVTNANPPPTSGGRV